MKKEEIQQYSEKLAAIRSRINTESSRKQADANRKYTLDSISRFLGNMEFAIRTYEQMGLDSELEDELA